ncbi:S9 family peptidase [soil metagenome]
MRNRLRFHLLVALLFFVAAPDAFAQSGAGLTPLQIGQMGLTTSATISPDGRHIAYTVSVPADPLEANAPASTQLYVVDTQSGQSSPLHTTSGVSSVAFRPEHGTVTFLASTTQGQTRGLYQISVNGGEPERLFTHEANILAYEWSPDGNRIAYASFESVEPARTSLPYAPDIYEEGLAQRLGYIGDVRSGSSLAIQEVGSYYHFAWSPSGERLAVSVAPSPMVDDMFMYQSVKVVNPVDGSITSTIDNRGKIGQIVWSPDGTQLALRAGHNINDPIDGRIMIVNATGGTPRNIRADFQGKFEQIAWTGADVIHFIASESTAKVFGTIQPDGNNMQPIVGGGFADLTSFSAADNGHVAFVASTPQHPGEVFFVPAGGTTPQRLTTHNTWLGNVAMGEQRVVRYPARDRAFDIEGLLILPVNHTQGTAVPTIVVVHGGPEAHYANGWLTNYSMPGQLAAGRGYAIFYPNYRGSTGRGLEFITSSQADLSGAEFDDIVDGVDYLIAQGIADPDRIGVTGGSYGGYATAWMATRYSDRFAAGVMNVGISNNLSKWGTSDIPDELYLVHSRERMWDSDAKWMDYLRRSPIYHMENARTPLLIMHGAEDTRVHPGQSLELYRHFRVRQPDVPVRLILYPGEGHGNVRSASRLDYTIRMIDWFDAFLMGDGEMPSRDLDIEGVATN